MFSDLELRKSGTILFHLLMTLGIKKEAAIHSCS